MNFPHSIKSNPPSTYPYENLSEPLDKTHTAIPPEPLEIDREPAYITRNILKSQHRAGGMEYLVDWEGYGPEEQSWVKTKDILDPLLTQNFHHHKWQPFIFYFTNLEVLLD